MPDVSCLGEKNPREWAWLQKFPENLWNHPFRNPRSATVRGNETVVLVEKLGVIMHI